MAFRPQCSCVTDVTGGEQEAPRPLLWLLIPGRPAVPFRAPPFDPARLDRPPGQTARLLREARLQAARRAARGAGGGGRSRDDDSDLQRRWEEASAKNNGRGPREWFAPARQLGMTQDQAAHTFGVSASAVRQAYRHGSQDAHPIGRRDAWDCWYARRADVAKHLGPAAAEHKALACEREAVRRSRLRLWKMEQERA